MKSLFLAFFFFACMITGKAQSKNEISVLQTLEWSTESQQEVKNEGYRKNTVKKMMLSYGLSYQRNLGKYSSLEIQSKLRSSENLIAISTPAVGNTSRYVFFTVHEKYISLPVLYKFRSRIADVTAGPTLDLFVSHKVIKEKSFAPALEPYDRFIGKKAGVGFATMLSKPITFNKHISFVPGIYYNTVPTLDRDYYGLQFMLQYKF